MGLSFKRQKGFDLVIASQNQKAKMFYSSGFSLMQRSAHQKSYVAVLKSVAFSKQSKKDSSKQFRSYAKGKATRKGVGQRGKSLWEVIKEAKRVSDIEKLAVVGKVYGIRPDQIEATVDALECGLSWDEFLFGA